MDEWRFSKRSLVTVPANVAHKDPDFWNTDNGKYPVERF